MALSRATVVPVLVAALVASSCSRSDREAQSASAVASAVAPGPPWTPGAPQPPAVYRFWIGDVGPSGPLFSGPQQVPFICTTVENGLGQPLVDNQDGVGNAVFPEASGAPDFAAAPVGYSRTCSIPTRVDYFYFSTSRHGFLPLADPAAAPAEDVDRVEIAGRTVPFVVRLERGTIDRFIYAIAMLAPFPESLESPARLDKRAWNGKLVYSFQGGVGIGRWQGFMNPLSRTGAMHEQALRRGYAVAFSTGNVMDTHYNLVLAGEVALMVKAHFIATYGLPSYTVGVGGSGGSIQQYAIAQNLPGLLDAIVPQYSYSDMVTQTIYVGDCELLERYFDASYFSALMTGHPELSPWTSWGARRLVEGLATNETANAPPWNASPFAPGPGSSECINGWRGLTPLVINPSWAPPAYFDLLRNYRYPESVIAAVHWTHWDDLGNIYPKDERGYAKITWDNVGVQYGLGALRRGELTTAQFLELNACVGTWMDSDDMTANHYPWNPAALPGTLDPWSKEDMLLSPASQAQLPGPGDLACATGTPAPRRTASLDAIHAAYESGHVFLGRIDLPIIDMRHYVDPVLDMHHAQQSFATRQRMMDASGGHPDDQVVWFADCSTMDPVALTRSCAFDPTGLAFDTIDRWIANIRRNPARGVAANKPPGAVDSCFAGDGSLIYAGADAWAGVLDDRPAGRCTSRYALHTTSRIEAGGGIAGDVFECALKDVAIALADGTYGAASFTSAEEERLGEIFPHGVCDYTQPDVGRPASVDAGAGGR